MFARFLLLAAAMNLPGVLCAAVADDPPAGDDVKAATRELAGKIRSVLPIGWSLDAGDDTLTLRRAKNVVFFGRVDDAKSGTSEEKEWSGPFSFSLKLGPNITGERYLQMIAEEKADRREIARCEEEKQNLENRKPQPWQTAMGEGVKPPTREEEERCAKGLCEAWRKYRRLPDLYFADCGVFFSHPLEWQTVVARAATRDELKALFATIRGLLTAAPAGRPAYVDYLKANVGSFSVSLLVRPLDGLIDPITRTPISARDEHAICFETAAGYGGRLEISAAQAERLIDALSRTGLLGETVDYANRTPWHLAETEPWNTSERHEAVPRCLAVLVHVNNVFDSARKSACPYLSADIPFDGPVVERLKGVLAALEGEAADDMQTFLSQLTRLLTMRGPDAGAKAAAKRLAEQIRPRLPRGWSVGVSGETVIIVRKEWVAFSQWMPMSLHPGTSRRIPVQYSVTLGIGPKVSAAEFRQMILEDRADRREIARHKERVQDLRRMFDTYTAKTADEKRRLKTFRDAERNWRRLPDLFYENRAVFFADSQPVNSFGPVVLDNFAPECQTVFCRICELTTAAPAGEPPHVEHLRRNADEFSLTLAVRPAGFQKNPKTGEWEAFGAYSIVLSTANPAHGDDEMPSPTEAQTRRILAAFKKAGIDVEKTVAHNEPLTETQTRQLIDGLAAAGIVREMGDERLTEAVDGRLFFTPHIQVDIATRERRLRAVVPWDARLVERLRTVRGAVDANVARHIDILLVVAGFYQDEWRREHREAAPAVCVHGRSRPVIGRCFAGGSWRTGRHAIVRHALTRLMRRPGAR